MDKETVIATIQKMAAGAAPLGNSLLFKMDEDAVHLDGTGDNNVVTVGEKEADCTISITKENFEKLVAGDLNPMTAVMTGKIKIGGDMSVAMKLQSLLG